MFRVGQKVVCVDDGPDHHGKKSRWMDGDKPTKGKIYEVTGLECYENRPCIFVTGHPGWSFYAWRFRPIIERKTDISFAHEILRKHTRKDRVCA